MKYGIALFPSKKLQDFANSFRKRYDPNYALITPHLTLKNAFEASDDEIKLISSRLEEVAEVNQPFLLKVYKFSSFYPVNNVIYLKVSPEKGLMKLHKSLHSGFFNDNTKYAFVPHITIGQNLSDDEHSDVLGQLQMTPFEHHTEEIDRFHLLYQLENGSWTVYETYRLGKNN